MHHLLTCFFMLMDHLSHAYESPLSCSCITSDISFFHSHACFQGKRKAVSGQQLPHNLHTHTFVSAAILAQAPPFSVVSRSGCLCNHGCNLPALLPSLGGPVASGSTTTAPALARHSASVCGLRRPSLHDALPLLLLHPLHCPERPLHHGLAQVRRTVELVAQGRAACVCGSL